MSSEKSENRICESCQFGMRAIYQKNIKTAILEAKRNGFSVLEIHLSSPQFSLSKYSKKELLSLRKFAEQQQIILQVHTSLEVSLLFIEPVFRQATKIYLKNVVWFSQVIGARCITIHPGSVFGYHTFDGIKIKNDDIYRKYYSKLFEDSLKFIASVATKPMFICIENTDNFNLDYQKILEKYLQRGNIFLTWDIRKNFYTEGNLLKKDQWNFIKRNSKYVKNIHISGLSGGHGKIETQEKRLNKVVKLFLKQNIPMVIEVLPLKASVDSKKNLQEIINKINL